MTDDLKARLRTAALMLPIRREDNADYAEVFGQDFQAMTMTPERFEALSALPEALARIEALEAAYAEAIAAWNRRPAQPETAPVDGEPFLREERYIVIKRKYLEPDQESDLRMFLSRRRIGTVECAVVESDWPEYEAVWKMIEDRVSGRPPSPTAEAVREACATVAERAELRGVLTPGWADGASSATAQIATAIRAMPLPTLRC